MGLFHNCGIPLLSTRFDDYSEVLTRAYAGAADACLTDVENALINTNHAVVGYYVAKSWNLPQHICKAIHNHHHVTRQFLDDPSSSQQKTLLAILKIAEHISQQYKSLGNCDTDYEWEQVKEAIFIYTGLTEYDYEGIVVQIRELGLGGG